MASQNTLNIVAACASITVFGLAFGMTYPLLSLILEERNVSADIIGLNSAMMPLGILLFSPLIPRFTRWLGARQLAIIAAALCGVLIISYKLFDNLPAWFLLRLLQGMSISTLFVLSEAWIVGYSSSQHRGKVVAIYASVLSASFGAGPALIGFLGTQGWTPFIIGSVSILVGIVPIAFIKETADKHHDTNTSGIFSFIPRAPMLIGAVLAFALFDAATLSLLPVYGVGNGLNQSTAAFALTALIIGNVFLQLPIGWLADKYDTRKMLTACAIITTLMVATLPWVINNRLLWPVLIVAGTTGYGVYTLALKSLGDRFSGQDLINGTAAFGTVWGLGALLGSIFAGWSMTLSVRMGLPVNLVIIYGILAIGLILRKQTPADQHDKQPAKSKTDA